MRQILYSAKLSETSWLAEQFTASDATTSSLCIHARSTTLGGMGRRYIPLLPLCSYIFCEHSSKWREDNDRWRLDLSWG